MNIKSLKLLRVGALVLGWLLLIGVFAGVWAQLVIYHRGQNDPTGFFGGVAAQFELTRSLSSLFSGFGNCFFAFLIAAVLRMIEKQAPVGNEDATRMMIVCCLSYLADAVCRFSSVILNLSGVLALRVADASNWRFWLPYSATLLSAFAPILYAASIFVLYTHFSKMVTFESEVA